VALLRLLQQLLGLLQLGVHQLLLQVFVLHHFVYVLVGGGETHGVKTSGECPFKKEEERESTDLLSQLVLLVELLQFLGQLGVLVAEAGVPLVVLLHLSLDVVQRHLEVGGHLLPLLLLQARPLRALLLRDGRRRRAATRLERGRAPQNHRNTVLSFGRKLVWSTDNYFFLKHKLSLST